MDLLTQLKTFTTVVADTGDFESIERYKPQDATTNPSLILQAAKNPSYQQIIDRLVRKPASGNRSEIVDDLFVEFGCRILTVIPGRVSTEVDARLSFDTEQTVVRARQLIGKYAARGIQSDRILIKIASTWEGIQACRILEAEGIHCNMTLMFGLHQAVACADAGATLISPFVGRILDWHKKQSGLAEYAPDEDPGVIFVREVFNYYKHFGIETEVMGASFRNVQEIIALSGCDLLTIAPKYLDVLQKESGDLSVALSSSQAKAMSPAEISALAATIDRPISKQQYELLHEENEMATQKLAEGIESFCQASISLEALVADILPSS